MKKLLDKISFLIFIVIVFIGLLNKVSAIEYKKIETLEIYKVRTIEEVLVSTSGILEIYENNFINMDINKEKDDDIKDLTHQNDIVLFSLNFIGNPYVMGGNSLTSGTDCSGFVQLIFSNFNIYLPRTTYGQSISGMEINLEDIEIGDIILYGYEGNIIHSALYIGNERVVHASTPELGIRIDSIYIMPIITIRRVIN